MKRRDSQLIEEIRQYLDDNLYRQHTIQGLCRQFTVNREKLQQGFNHLVKSTVHAYIIRQRLKRAAQRLIESDDSIKAIAIESGYKKQRSFNKTSMWFTRAKSRCRNSKEGSNGTYFCQMSSGGWKMIRSTSS